MKILHCANLCWVGGVGEFIKSFSRAFPEFQHEVLFLRDINDNYKYYQSFQTLGIRAYHSLEITEELIDGINPKIICLHNPPESLWQKELKDLNILQKYQTIQFHHNKCKIFPHINLHIFVSDWIKEAYKDFSKYIQKSKIVHPCVDAEPYLNIKREYNKKENVIVGRIQSNTNNFRGKFSEDVGMLKKLKNAKFFLVGDGYEKTSNPRFAFLPIKQGAMRNYLEKIDIFYIWGGKGHVESWSRVISEALLSGLPVVIRDMKDGMSEQVRKSGVGFLVNTEEEFIETVQKLINNPELRKKHGELGRKWASENLTIKNLRQNLINEMFEFATN